MNIEELIEKYKPEKGDIAKARSIEMHVLMELINDGMDEFEAKKVAFEKALEKITTGIKVTPKKPKSKSIKETKKTKEKAKKPQVEEKPKSKTKKANDKKAKTTAKKSKNAEDKKKVVKDKKKSE